MEIGGQREGKEREGMHRNPVMGENARAEGRDTGPTCHWPAFVKLILSQ
jgi:hypothetical protein